MDIRILDSHLKEHLKTSATPEEIAKAMSLSSASIEKIEPFENDFIYHIEVTTNRPDMMSVTGIAREAGAILPEFGIPAIYQPLKVTKPTLPKEPITDLVVKNNDMLVRRICYVVMDVTIGDSPDFVKKRLEAAGIRSLNNLIDITNYVMLEVGHPTHVFDYDRLTTKKLLIRESKKGEKIITLDKKEYTLSGGDIVADNGKGEIVDLLGVMGTLNSVVTNGTKHVLFFIDNNDPWRIRKTSMSLGIRTEAATINEKGIDVELAMTALLRGIALFKEHANAKVISDIIDIYPHHVSQKTVAVDIKKISQIIGVEVSIAKSVEILESLGFKVKKELAVMTVTVPRWREQDVTIEEDVIEEIARVYGYYNLPSLLPPYETATPFNLSTNIFYWEQKAREAMKYWGFTEVYTLSLVSETLLDGPTDEAVKLENPLDNEHVYLRKTLTPSLLEVLQENKGREDIAIFELANTYHKTHQGLPREVQMLGITKKGTGADFPHMKGIVEQLAKDFGVAELYFTDLARGGLGADVLLGKKHLAEIEIL